MELHPSCDLAAGSLLDLHSSASIPAMPNRWTESATYSEFVESFFVFCEPIVQRVNSAHIPTLNRINSFDGCARYPFFRRISINREILKGTQAGNACGRGAAMAGPAAREIESTTAQAVPFPSFAELSF
jgi:hypothetical protein